MGYTDKLNQSVEFIVQNGICTNDEYRLVSCIAGHSLGTVNGIIYARTAYHDIEQLKDCEPDGYDFSMCSFLDEDEEEEDEEDEG